MSRGNKVKCGHFNMRTDTAFEKNLTWLSQELGVTKSQAVEIAVNLFPELVKLQSKLDRMVAEAQRDL